MIGYLCTDNQPDLSRMHMSAAAHIAKIALELKLQQQQISNTVTLPVQ